MPYLFLLPAFVLLGIFFFLPFLQTICLSFSDYTQSLYQPAFAGFGNYAAVLNDPVFTKVLVNTFVFLIIAVPFLTIFPLFLAILVNQKLRAVKLYKVVIYLPVVVSIVVCAIAFKWLYAEHGIFNYFLSLFHLPPIGWLTDTKYSLFSVALETIWKVSVIIW